VSSRLGETNCTVDLDRAAIEERALAAAEDLVNAVVEDDVEVRQLHPRDAAELAALPLRKPPKVTEGIRIVAVGEFDYTPCGGTHCTRSAQVGLVRISGVERYKGGTRVYFEAGRRARAALGAHSDALRALARDLTCGPAEVPGAIQKLRGELAKARESLGDARARLASAAADGLLAEARAAAGAAGPGAAGTGAAGAAGPGAAGTRAAGAAGALRVVAVLDDPDPEMARAVAGRVVAAAPDAIAFVAARGADGLHVLIARGASSTFDCGAFLKRAAAAHGGRGGGRAERAEGRLPAGADWPAIVAALAV